MLFYKYMYTPYDNIVFLRVVVDENYSQTQMNYKWLCGQIEVDERKGMYEPHIALNIEVDEGIISMYN